MKKSRYNKVLILFGLIAAVVLSTLCFASCSASDPPPVEEIYDRLVYLIENSAEVNTVFFGEGLPVYRRGSDEAELLRIYYMSSDEVLEEVKLQYCEYLTLEEVKAKAELVYGEEYRESLYETVFTGYAISESSGSILPARYSEDEKGIYQNSEVTPLVSGVRNYDYASMKIVSGNKKYIRVEIESYTDAAPDERVVSKLSFVYERGNWYLNSPSC